MALATTGNLFSDLPTDRRAEVFAELLTGGTFKLERIVSNGQATPAGEWYDQEQAEWVIVLKGSATLTFDGEDGTREMAEGDYVLIPPHLRHRVESTHATLPTVWLALHFSEG